MFREPSWQADIVGIERGDELPPRHRQAPVARTDHAQVAFIAHNHKPRVAIAGQYARRGVGGGVVDDDQLEVREGLTQHAIDRLRQIRRGVIGRGDDTDPWRGDVQVGIGVHAVLHNYVVTIPGPG